MRFVIYGAGAIGGVLGARLHQAGHDVVLIARGAHLDAIRANGLRVDGPAGSETLALEAVGDPSDIDITADDVVVVAVKSQDTQGVLDRLSACAPTTTAIACAQNGIDNERRALRLFERVYGLCEVFPASHLEPGVVSADAAPITGIIDLGRYPSGVDDLASELAVVLNQATFDSRALPDVMRWKRAKLLTNLGNAVQVLCESDAWGEVSELARAEGRAVLDTAGLDYASADEDRARRGSAFQRQTTMGMRGGSSTWQSVARRAGSVEVDYLNGEIVLLGRVHDVATPVNATIQRLANDRARRRLPPGELTAAQLLAELDGRAPSTR
jgi:2-dehydropantoate 2-reductase